MFVVYRTEYLGLLMPKYYLGSTSEERLKAGYIGSVSSKKYKLIWKKESEENPQLFKCEILGKYDTRTAALNAEYDFQKQFNVVENPEYINMAFAKPDGFFGMDVKGSNNPMFGKKHSAAAKEKMSKARQGKAISNAHKENISASITAVYESIRGNTIKKIQSTASSGENNPMFGRIGENNPNFGLKRTAETKLAISNALKKHKRSNEHNLKLSSTYEIDIGDDILIIGRNISEFCNTLGFNTTSLLYTLKSKKFFRGFKVVRKITNFSDCDEKTSVPSLKDVYSKLKDLSSIDLK